jgi:hypothetical protein
MKISKITEDSMGFGNTHRFWATPKREFFTKVVNTLWSGGRDRGEEVAARMGLSRDMVPVLDPRDEELPIELSILRSWGWWERVYQTWGCQMGWSRV